MASLTLSQTGIYHLQQLSQLVKQKTGVRHRLSEQKDIIYLLRYSSISIDQAVYDLYNQFTDSLEEDQRIYLQSRGILLPKMIQATAVDTHKHLSQHFQ